MARSKESITKQRATNARMKESVAGILEDRDSEIEAAKGKVNEDFRPEFQDLTARRKKAREAAISVVIEKYRPIISAAREKAVLREIDPEKAYKLILAGEKKKAALVAERKAAELHKQWLEKQGGTDVVEVEDEETPEEFVEEAAE